MTKICKHEFRAIENNSVGYYGILLYCVKCGKPHTYNRNWEIESLNEDEE